MSRRPRLLELPDTRFVDAFASRARSSREILSACAPRALAVFLSALPSPAFTPLPPSFYRGRVLDVARALIGKVLVHAAAEGTMAGRIVECEAYRGPEDLAAHSARGRRTARTEVMFGPPGRAYMYFVYGMHWAFNVVVGEEGQPHAILVRALEPVVGAELMAARRGFPAESRDLANGPGKLCAALGLDAAFYGADLRGPTLLLAEGERRGAVGRATRIGVAYAGAWADKPWRFYEKGSPFVSVIPKLARR